MTRTARNSLTSSSPSPLTVSPILTARVKENSNRIWYGVRGDSVGDILDHVPAGLAGGICTDRHRVIQAHARTNVRRSWYVAGDPRDRPDGH